MQGVLANQHVQLPESAPCVSSASGSAQAACSVDPDRSDRACHKLPGSFPHCHSAKPFSATLACPPGLPLAATHPRQILRGLAESRQVVPCLSPYYGLLKAHAFPLRFTCSIGYTSAGNS